MKKQTKILLLIILIITLLSIYLFISKNQNSTLCINNSCFNIEVAKTHQELANGLMNRTSLAQDSGMLFIFEKEDNYSFWMKNTLIPLDMIWINKDNKIVFIQKNAEPCREEFCETFSSDKPAKYVLEINGGLSEEMGIRVGDGIDLG